MIDRTLDLQDVFDLRDWFVQTQLDITFYDYQTDISNRIIRTLLLQTGERIPIEISRQAGKTEAIVCTIVFLMTFSLQLTEEFWGIRHPFRIIIFAPQDEQAKTDFDRIKNYLQKISVIKGWGDVVDSEESNQRTLQISNGAFCYKFPLKPTSNVESKTGDLLIFEEAHKIIDSEKSNKADPMGATTNAPEVSIGVGWYDKNYFKRQIDEIPDHPRYPAKKVIEVRRKAYERDGNPMHLLYEKHYKKRVDEAGAEDVAVRTQYDLEWILEAGEFFTAEDWDRITSPYKAVLNGKKVLVKPKLLKSDLKSHCFAGIDTAKSPDSTVVTIIRINPQTGWRELVALLELHGENYVDQFEIITGFNTQLGKYSETKKGLFQNFNVKAVAIDSTGQGSFMPDMFERHTRWRDERSGLFPLKFSLQSKDRLYTILQQTFKNNLTAVPDQNTKQLRKLRKQMIQLEKEYKGQFLSVHHPVDESGQQNYHDDYPDSWALAEYAHAMKSRIAVPTVTVVR